MTSDLLLDFLGQVIKISAVDEGSQQSLEYLREDFLNFETEKPEAPPCAFFTLKNSAITDFKIKSGPIFKTRMCQVYGMGAQRICDYGGGTVLYSSENGVRRFSIHSSKGDELYEVAFAAVLSVVGEALDRCGFHRVHGLGLEVGGKRVLITLPQGGGKSAMATLLSRIEDYKILSDEIPLLKGSEIYPFPLRLALRPEVARGLGVENGRPFLRKIFDTKELFPLPAEKIGRPGRVSVILAGRKVRGAPRIRRGHFLVSLGTLLENMVLGLGVPQMAEHMLRLNALGALVTIALSRAKEAIGLSCSSRSFIFEVGPDARENVEVLKNFLNLIPS